jgi:alpha 1,3-glucosidase
VRHLNDSTVWPTQAGAFSPFFRAHAHIDTRRREPWLFSESTRLHIREAIRRRYSLLPYWYTLFAEHARTGMPVLRPMWMEFPTDKFTFDDDRHMMVGGALLVRPVTEPDVPRVSVYLPGEGVVGDCFFTCQRSICVFQYWYEWDTQRGRPGPGAVQVDTPMDKIPVYQRGGTIVPTRERVRRSSALMALDPYTLRVALSGGDNRHANGEVSHL